MLKKGASKGKKWRIWRSSSGDLSSGSSWKGFKGHHRSFAGSECSDSSSVNNDAFTAAVATVVRAPPKDFRAVRQEWAAIRIQTAFRGFLVIFPLSLFLYFSVSLFSVSSSPLVHTCEIYLSFYFASPTLLRFSLYKFSP